MAERINQHTTVNRGGDFLIKNKQNRQSNIELLRIISMFLVLLIHYIPQREIPSSTSLANNPYDTLFNLEIKSICFVCVNCFVLISGYFGIRWKYKSFCNLIFQIFFWITLSYLIAICMGYTHFGIKTFIQNAVYGTIQRWFIIAYLGLYMMAPVLNSFLDNNSHKTILTLILGFYGFSTVVGYLGTAPEFNRGMSTISLMGLYLIGAYIRRFPAYITKYNKYFYLTAYFSLGFLMVFISALALKMSISQSPYGYLNPIIILESVALFIFFIKTKIPYSKQINRIAASAFAVYLFHTNLFIYEHYQAACSQIETDYNFAYGILFMATVFTISVLLDKGRIALSKRIIR